MKTKEIRDLIDFISKSGLNEVNIETEELKISVKRDAEVQTQIMNSAPSIVAPAAQPMAAAPAPAPAATSSAPMQATASSSSNYIEIKSPMIGTFYRSANPESAPFVSVGDKIEAGNPCCIIEAMKLFNEIESEVEGKVVKVVAEDATPVEYDQPLFLIEPN